MTGLGALVGAAALTAVGAYLVLRIAVRSWGRPHLPDRVFRFFEMAPGGATVSTGDALVCAVLLGVLEATAFVSVSDGLAKSDYFTAAMFSIPIVASAAWFVFLRSRPRIHNT